MSVTVSVPVMERRSGVWNGDPDREVENGVQRRITGGALGLTASSDRSQKAKRFLYRSRQEVWHSAQAAVTK